jgi:hypothetical protein
MIKAIYRKIQQGFKPKIGKISLGVSFFEQLPSFATDNHISMMNSQL